MTNTIYPSKIHVRCCQLSYSKDIWPAPGAPIISIFMSLHMRMSQEEEGCSPRVGQIHHFSGKCYIFFRQ